MHRVVDTEDCEMLSAICEEAGIESFAYRGRGDDDECVAIRVDSDTTEFRVIADLVDACQGDIERTDILSHALRVARTDQLGKGMVIYFPPYKEV